MKGHKPNHRGVALVTVLLITALATIIAVSMATRQQFDTQRTINIIEGDQANLLALGIEVWGQEILEKDLIKSQHDHLQEDWAKELSPIEVDAGRVSGNIEDLQARFNLNNLAFLPTPPPPNTGNDNDESSDTQTQGETQPPPKDPIGQYTRLLTHLGIDESQIESLTMALVDWVDTDQNTRFPGGAEDNDYLDQEPAYRTANALLRSTSELLWIKGYDEEILSLIEPFVTALPQATHININTAPVEVLMSLADGIDDLVANDIIENRGDEGYHSIQNFLQQDLLSGITIPSESMGVDSQYFVVHGLAQFGKISKQSHSVIAREKNKPSQVIVRSQGSY